MEYHIIDRETHDETTIRAANLDQAIEAAQSWAIDQREDGATFSTELEIVALDGNDAVELVGYAVE